ncbi:uncharacterized protein K02A2.6-like [Pistacia vera]|uniref:uncharacterized protein K02A2.6-like n=1 Tax=Pistacia vera TaxID=55513 RepID=UPI00126373ED|nr:uncharacterized protein K02A2.6-like [Pistacia vera]
MEGIEPFKSWDEFKVALIARFWPSFQGSTHEALVALKQYSTVTEYREDFESYTAPLKDLGPSRGGKKIGSWIRVGPKHSGPKDPGKATHEFLAAQTQIDPHGGPTQQRHPETPTRPVWWPNLTKPPDPSQIASSRTPDRKERSSENASASFRGGSGGGFRCLSEADIQYKRERGLCFQCDEKFGPNHRCRSKSLQILLVLDDDESEKSEAPSENDENHNQEGNDLALSMNSIVGITSDKTLKVKGQIRGSEVVVLVNSGASHNFISLELVERLGIAVEKGKIFGVMVGNGVTVKGEGVCRQVTLDVQGIQIRQDFFSFELEGADIVLGITWLSSLRDVCANWKKLTMSFEVNEVRVSLQGDPSLVKSVVSLKSMLRTISHNGGGFLVECCSLGRILTTIEEELCPRVQAVLDQYRHLFDQPSKISPHRTYDHTINLKEGAPVPNIRPYRYPYFQKNEIEKLVEEMLAARIIQPSTSPFASPVLLVKKNDGSWRFCVDYRTLNDITIPDKFSIPTIEELLDELVGATIFSKLDLRSGYHQIRIKDEDIPKTAFRTHERHYKFLVMPFGLTNTPSTFQSLMNIIFKPVLRKFVLQKLEYLGHLISTNGIKVDPQKIDAMVSWPTPTNVKSLCDFLGLMGYYRSWDQEAQQAFQALKEAMTSVPVLAAPDFNSPFEIHTDALGYGMGAVLVQNK